MIVRESPFERIFRPGEGDLPPVLATYLLHLDFPSTDHSRYEQLSERAQEGTLTSDEEAELDELLAANDVLAILQSKARASLNRQTPAV